MSDTRFEIKGIEKLKNRLDYANMTAKPIRDLFARRIGGIGDLFKEIMT